MPKTPYQCVMEREDVSSEKKEELRKKHAELNPFELKREIEKKLKRIFKYVRLNPKPRKKI